MDLTVIFRFHKLLVFNTQLTWGDERHQSNPLITFYGFKSLTVYVSENDAILK
jgi:hypothetical protein